MQVGGKNNGVKRRTLRYKMAFNGNYDISFPYNATDMDLGTSSWSISFWFKPNSISQNRCVFRAGFNSTTIALSPLLFLVIDQRLLFYSSNNTVSWNLFAGFEIINNLQANQWYHVFVRRSVNTWTFWVNNTLVATFTVTNSLIIANSTYNIGFYTDDFLRANDDMHSFFFTKKALTDAEKTDLYNNKSPITDSLTLLWLPPNLMEDDVVPSGGILANGTLHQINAPNPTFYVLR